MENPDVTMIVVVRGEVVSQVSARAAGEQTETAVSVMNGIRERFHVGWWLLACRAVLEHHMSEGLPDEYLHAVAGAIDAALLLNEETIAEELEAEGIDEEPQRDFRHDAGMDEFFSKLFGMEPEE